MQLIGKPAGPGRRRLATAGRLAAATVLVATGAFATAAPAYADDVITPMAVPCETQGERFYTVASVATPKKITHAERYYNGTGASLSTSFTAYKETTLTAGVTVTTGGSVEANTVIAKLSASTSYSLALSGSSTSGSSVSVTATLPHGKYLVAYRGNVQVTGNYTYWHCTGGVLLATSKGTARSFTKVPETGAQRCDLSAPSGSLAAVAKGYC